MTANQPTSKLQSQRLPLKQTWHPHASKLAFAKWALTLPIRSYLGSQLCARQVKKRVPAIWNQEITGKDILIVGTGPSLDGVSNKYINSFDVRILLNNAISFCDPNRINYFLTTDIGPLAEYMKSHGCQSLNDIGQHRCLFAPIFPDQYFRFRPEGRKLFTWMYSSRSQLRIEVARVSILGRAMKLPFTLRIEPEQPDWDKLRIPLEPSSQIPIFRGTSALTAVVFAAQNAARSITLIGCDFSAGRSQRIIDLQKAAGSNAFGVAREKFNVLKTQIEYLGIPVHNASWDAPRKQNQTGDRQPS